MLESQNLLHDSVRVYIVFSKATHEQVCEIMGEGASQEAEDDDPSEVVDLKRNHGHVLHKLGCIYSSNEYEKANNDIAISNFKLAINLVHGLNNKQKIALQLQALLVQDGREHEMAPYKEYLPDNNLSDSNE